MTEARRVRYAVVGLGHIAQVAVLPGFAHAERAQLVALFSRDPEKREVLGRQYGVERTYDYDAYDEVLASGAIDAVYIALPNHLHRDFAVRAAQHGVHVLVEKPMAVDEQECEAMIEAARQHGVKLMVAYRLHFDPANLEAVGLVRSGKLGTPRLFASTFSQDVVDGNVRLLPVAQGGGPMYDMGIYCLNAARYLFGAEPTRVFAQTSSRDDPRFADAPEMLSAVLHFPGQCQATFTCSFGAADTSRYEIVGDAGRLVMEPAYEYVEGLEYTLELTDAKRAKSRSFGKHDQFGAELDYFAGCILDGRAVEPDGYEGLADVRIIRALHLSAAEGRIVDVEPVQKWLRPDGEQAYALPRVRKPKTVNVQSASGE